MIIYYNVYILLIIIIYMYLFIFTCIIFTYILHITYIYIYIKNKFKKLYHKYLRNSIHIYRVTHFNLGSQITRKLSPANKNVSDKSCMVSRGP